MHASQLFRGLLLAAACSTAFSASFAQTAEKMKAKVRLNADEEPKDKRPLSELIPLNDRALLVLRGQEPGSGVREYAKSAGRLELYDRAKLNLLRSQEPVLKAGKMPLFLETVAVLGGKPVMVAAHRDTIRGTTQLFWQKADPNLTLPHAPFEPLCTFDTRAYGYGTPVKEGSGYRDEFLSVVSPNKELMLVYSPLVKSPKGTATRPMVLVDKDMAIVWKMAPDAPDRTLLMSVLLDNAGQTYLLERVPLGPKDVRKDTTSFRLRLSRMSDEGPVEIALDLGSSRFAKSATLKLQPDGMVLYAGVYTGIDGQDNPMIGEFIGHVPGGAEKVELVSTNAFTIDPDAGLYTKGGFRFLDIHPLKKGGFFVLKEHFLETDQVDAKTGMAGLRWIHGPVVVSKLDANGEEQWNSTFNRLQFATDPMVGEVFSLTYNDELAVFLIDSDEQTEKRKSNAKLNHMDQKTPFSAFIVFDAKGVPKAKSVLRSTGANDYILGKRIIQAGPAEYYLPGSHKLSADRTQPVRIDMLAE